MNEKTLPFVSVIVPVYNDSARLKLCLEALEQQTYPSDLYEVIIVDNASVEPVAPVVEPFARVKLVHEANPGPDPARNAGLAVAKGDYMAFTDSDCIPYPDWLERGINALLQHPEAGLVGGRVDVFSKDEANPTWVELYESVYAFPTHLNIQRDRFMPTCNMFTTRRMFDLVGQFVTGLGIPGDQEWGNRVHAAGCALVYKEDVAIRHPARHTYAEVHKKMKRTTHRYVGMVKSQSKLPLPLTYRYIKRFFILPTPYEIKKLAASPLNLTQKAKALSVVMRLRFDRAREMIRALSGDQERLW